MIHRNLNMVTKIAGLVSEEERVFCCIGAAHTTGEMSARTFLDDFSLNTERVLV